VTTSLLLLHTLLLMQETQQIPPTLTITTLGESAEFTILIMAFQLVPDLVGKLQTRKMIQQTSKKRTPGPLVLFGVTSVQMATTLDWLLVQLKVIEMTLAMMILLPMRFTTQWQ
jgi:hypothetical protein